MSGHDYSGYTDQQIYDQQRSVDVYTERLNGLGNPHLTCPKRNCSVQVVIPSRRFHGGVIRYYRFTAKHS